MKSTSHQGVLDVGIYVKPTEMHRPLCISSCHPIDTHLAWPKGLAYRAASLTSTSVLHQSELQRLHHMFASRFGSHYATSVLSHMPLKKSNIISNRCQRSFLVVPYARQYDLFPGMRKILRESSLAFQAAGISVSIQMAFRNGGQHLHHHLEKHRHQQITNPQGCFIISEGR